MGPTLVVGAFLSFVDTVFTYVTSHAPFGDVVLILALPVLVICAVAILSFVVTRWAGGSAHAPRAVETTALIAPVFLFGMRGCIHGCDITGWNLVLRWMPTAVLLCVIAVEARRASSWRPLPRLLMLAGVTQLLAASAFAIRTDEFPTFSIEPVLICAVPLAAFYVDRRFGGRQSSALAMAAVLVALAMSVAWVFRAAPPRLRGDGTVTADPSRPNVLLVVLDTVRSDHLSLYGYPRRTSPNLDAFASQALVFDRARANATYSLASHASIFAGLLASQHGARPIPNRWFESHPTLKLAARNFRMRADAPTVVQDLKAAGYVTAGISANDVFLASWTGLQRGFDAFEAKARRRYRYFPLAAPFIAHALPYLGISEGSFFQDTWRAPDITDAAIAWLEATPKPFFLFINYFDAHGPYDPPGGSPFRGDRIAGGGDVADYDGEIAFLDGHLGRLFRFLRDRGLLDRTLVIITADHGEYFGEHGLLGHQAVLYEPVLSVPLVVRLPGAASRGRVQRWTGLHEIRGLVREVLGGRSRLSILSDRTAPVPLAEAWTGADLVDEPSSVVVYAGNLKLVANRLSRGAMFNLAEDPGESHNLLKEPSPDTKDVYARMLLALGMDPTARMGESPDAPQEAIERLRALGYVQ